MIRFNLNLLDCSLNNKFHPTPKQVVDRFNFFNNFFPSVICLNLNLLRLLTEQQIPPPPTDWAAKSRVHYS